MKILYWSRLYESLSSSSSSLVLCPKAGPMAVKERKIELEEKKEWEEGDGRDGRGREKKKGESSLVLCPKAGPMAPNYPHLASISQHPIYLSLLPTSCIALLSPTGAIFVLGRMFLEVAPLVLPQIPPFSRLLRHVGVLTSGLFSICPTPAELMLYNVMHIFMYMHVYVLHM